MICFALYFSFDIPNWPYVAFLNFCIFTLTVALLDLSFVGEFQYLLLSKLSLLLALFWRVFGEIVGESDLLF